MKTHTPTRSRRALSGVLAGAAALLLAFGGATAATAVENESLIDPSEKGSITIHKLEQSGTVGAPATGLVDTAVVGTPIAGVEYEVARVTEVTVGELTHSLDLTTNEGWANAAKLRVDEQVFTYNGEVATATQITAGNSDITDQDGLAEFAGLDLGVYYVTEVSAPEGVTPAAPWLMTVPMTYPGTSDSWLYDIHVYPKNTSVNATMAVNDAAAVKLGDEFDWTIEASLPRIANAGYEDGAPEATKFQAPSNYQIVDTLDDALTYVSATVALIGTDVTLEAGDYTVTYEAATNTLTIAFTTAGLNTLGEAAATDGAKVQLTVTTSANAVGEIQNQASILVNDAEALPTNIVETHWGDILIKKVNANDTSEALGGATFQVYGTETAANAGNGAIAIGGASTFTTVSDEVNADVDGTVRISGLRYSDFENGDTATTPRNYYLVETVAPDGYQLLVEPIEVTVADFGEDTLVTVVENAPKGDGFVLPLTGGAGTWMFVVGGALLLAGALVVAFRKKPAETTTAAQA